MPIKTLCVFGTRPEAIKMAPVAISLAKDDRFDSLVCVTGQHRQMLDQVLSLFSIQADYDLKVMGKAGDLTGVTANMLCGLRDVIQDSTPDIVLVHGDTATTLAASIAAYYQGVPIAHVEAGLRTGKLYSPWPEEGNRLVATALAAFHFAPTEEARRNLIDNGVNPGRIHVTGNTVIDALLMTKAKFQQSGSLQLGMQSRFGFLDQYSKIILVTGHRRENFGGGLEAICRAISMIAAANPNVAIVFPVHLNPNVNEPVRHALGNVANVFLLEPLDYESFVYLMSACLFVLTDSGGVQEEAPALGKPVLLMRDTTERPEAVSAGTVRLVGTDPGVIFSDASLLLEEGEVYQNMSRAQNPYGDGFAASRIRDALVNFAQALT